MKYEGHLYPGDNGVMFQEEIEFAAKLLDCPKEEIACITGTGKVDQLTYSVKTFIPTGLPFQSTIDSQYRLGLLETTPAVEMACDGIYAYALKRNDFRRLEARVL